MQNILKNPRMKLQQRITIEIIKQGNQDQNNWDMTYVKIDPKITVRQEYKKEQFI